MFHIISHKLFKNKGNTILSVLLIVPSQTKGYKIIKLACIKHSTVILNYCLEEFTTCTLIWQISGNVEVFCYILSNTLINISVMTTLQYYLVVLLKIQ